VFWKQGRHRCSKHSDPLAAGHTAAWTRAYLRRTALAGSLRALAGGAIA
jgi:hypothetical protein